MTKLTLMSKDLSWCAKRSCELNPRNRVVLVPLDGVTYKRENAMVIGNFGFEFCLKMRNSFEIFIVGINSKISLPIHIYLLNFTLISFFLFKCLLIGTLNLNIIKVHFEGVGVCLFFSFQRPGLFFSRPLQTSTSSFFGRKKWERQ